MKLERNAFRKSWNFNIIQNRIILRLFMPTYLLIGEIILPMFCFLWIKNKLRQQSSYCILDMLPRLASNSNYLCVNFLGARIASVSHHIWVLFCLLECLVDRTLSLLKCSEHTFVSNSISILTLCHSWLYLKEVAECERCTPS